MIEINEKKNIYTKIYVTLDSGVLTNRVFGAYNYEGGEQVYVITYGDRSVTEPEYDASLAVKTDAPVEQNQQNTESDIWLYAGIGAFVLVIAAVVILLLKKKKPAKQTFTEPLLMGE